MKLQETKSSIKNTLHISINKRRSLWPGITQLTQNQINRMEWAPFKAVQDRSGLGQVPKCPYLCRKEYCNERQLSPAGTKSNSATCSGVGLGEPRRLLTFSHLCRSWDIARGKHPSIHKSLQFILPLFYLFEKQNGYNPVSFWNRPNRSDRRARK